VKYEIYLNYELNLPIVLILIMLIVTDLGDVFICDVMVSE